MVYNELEQRGTADFPIEYYFIDKNHARYDMSAHWHSELEIIRVLQGSLRVRLNNQSYIARKGDAVFVNPETVHSAFPEDCVYECIVFHIEFLDTDTYSCKFFVESILNHEYAIKEFVSGKKTEIGDAVSCLFENMKKKSSGYKFLVIGALYRLLGVIVNEHLYRVMTAQSDISEARSLPKLRRVLSYIRLNFDKQITLLDMAEAAGMSRRYFCDFFKKMTGKTPVEYLNGYRIEKALQKLSYTDLSVTEIAFLCGFNDLSYFIKTFKRVKGITPAKYRKAESI